MKTESQKESINEKNTESIPNKKNNNMLLAAFIMFIFPMAITFLGVFIGDYIGKFLEASIIIFRIGGGIIGFGLSAVIIKLFDKSLKVDEKVEKIHWDDL